jgi:hypothetical protein
LDRINAHRPSVRSTPTASPSAGSADGTPGTSRARGKQPLNPNAAPFSPQPARPVSPRTAVMDQLVGLEMGSRKPQSRQNGYKLMSPHIQEAVRQSQQLLPPNIAGFQPNPREHSVVFHQNPATGKLEAGSRMGGNEYSVAAPDDLYWPTAKVHVHSHPYTGTEGDFVPSMGDQNIARKHPHIDFLVQAPTIAPGTPNAYTLYKGTFPPRHYTLVENPHNLPVQPDSPDMKSMPPYKPHPFR